MEKEKNSKASSHQADDQSKDPGMTTYDNSAIYHYNPETGKWEVRNPAGSIGYNYLYRDEIDF